MTDIAVSIEHLSKRYVLGANADPYGRMTETLSRAFTSLFQRRQSSRPATRELWALSDVSMQIVKGEVVGVIGRNGAGKSTLLKILSRITEPTTGRATMHGRVGSLLEVGTGFHPELSGRENVYLSGAILGMRRAEINRRFGDIVAFAEVERFLDTPVKRYSSGMKVRLGFAVAAFLEPEILVVDEVLAVGDASFQKRSLAKMEDVTHEGRTVIFVSHNMASVEGLCTRGVLIESGRVAAEGPVGDVVQRYLKSVEIPQEGGIVDREDRQGDGRLRFIEVDSSVRLGANSKIRLAFEGEPGLRNVEVSLGIFTLRGEGVLFLGNSLTGQEFAELPRAGTIVCDLDRASLRPGLYTMNIYCTVNGIVADWVQDAARVEVAEGDYYGTGRMPPPGYGHVLSGQRWSIEAG